MRHDDWNDKEPVVDGQKVLLRHQSIRAYATLDDQGRLMAVGRNPSQATVFTIMKVE